MAPRRNKPAERSLPLTNAEARTLLNQLTPSQLDEIGVMIGMSNLGADRYDRPESLAESDEMYEGFMEEIRDWQRQLRDPNEQWGWCSDLEEMATEAVKRRPAKT